MGEVYGSVELDGGRTPRSAVIIDGASNDDETTKGSFLQMIKVYGGLAVFVGFIVAELLHYVKCGIHDIDEDGQCTFFPAWFETLLTWCDCLCVAGLWVGFVGFVVQ